MVYNLIDATVGLQISNEAAENRARGVSHEAARVVEGEFLHPRKLEELHPPRNQSLIREEIRQDTLLP